MASPFRPALALLKQYAEYHRDRRNIATHLLGVPIIVLGLSVLLARGGADWGGLTLTPAWAAFALVALWYLTRGHLGIGAATAAFVGVITALGHSVNSGSVSNGMAWGLGLFVVGWIIQFVGHYYEGKKPAFADDLVGLLVGPMFVVFELGVSLGLFRDLQRQVEAHAGPTVLRDLAHPATR